MRMSIYSFLILFLCMTVTLAHTRMLLYLSICAGPEAAGHPEAHDAPPPEGGRGEEAGPQTGDHHRGGAHQHSEEVLPRHPGEELLLPGQGGRPGQRAQPGQHHDGVTQVLQPPLPHQRYAIDLANTPPPALLHGQYTHSDQCVFELDGYSPNPWKICAEWLFHVHLNHAPTSHQAHYLLLAYSSFYIHEVSINNTMITLSFVPSYMNFSAGSKNKLQWKKKCFNARANLKY